MNPKNKSQKMLLFFIASLSLLALACGQVVVQQVDPQGQTQSGGVELPESQADGGSANMDLDEIVQDPDFSSEDNIESEGTFDNEPMTDNAVPQFAGEEFTNEFESADSWETINDGAVFGEVDQGTFTYGIDQSDSFGWTVAGTLGYGDGVFEVETVQSSGPEDAGYGLIFREQDTDFYLFTISTDGLVWIGYCEDACDTADALVGDGWFESDAINVGEGAINHLIVEADGDNLAFFVNDQLLGEAFDNRLNAGDLGMYVESGEIGVDDDLVLVQFDNLYFTPFEN